MPQRPHDSETVPQRPHDSETFPQLAWPYSIAQALLQVTAQALLQVTDAAGHSCIAAHQARSERQPVSGACDSDGTTGATSVHAGARRIHGLADTVEMLTARLVPPAYMLVPDEYMDWLIQ
jgi:hypothetical protein